MRMIPLTFAAAAVAIASSAHARPVTELRSSLAPEQAKECLYTQFRKRGDAPIPTQVDGKWVIDFALYPRVHLTLSPDAQGGTLITHEGLGSSIVVKGAQGVCSVQRIDQVASR